MHDVHLPLSPALHVDTAGDRGPKSPGLPGVGKTHLAVAQGREAIPRGYSTLVTLATSVVTQLARIEGRPEEKLAHSPSPLKDHSTNAAMARASRSCWMWA